MSIIELLLKEIDQEAAITRKMLGRVPDDQYDWKPHEKSMTLKRLATHIAELPGWIAMAIETSELNFEASNYKPTEIKNQQELLQCFEENLVKGREKLAQSSEDELWKMWTMRSGDQIYSKTSKYEVIRMSLAQTIHHRAQLGVFLRLLNIPIPGSYGPSADEQGF